MGWADLLADAQERVMPWLGGRTVYGGGRAFAVQGALPPEHGWHRFSTAGSKRATWLGEGSADPDYEEGRALVRGYMVGNRLIADDAAVRPDIHAVLEQSRPVRLVERGLERFARATAARHDDGQWIYVRQEFPLGPELEVLEAWQDGRDDLSGIAGVTPALELAFRWTGWQRLLAEERRAEAVAEAELWAEAEAEARRCAEEAQRRAEYEARVGRASARRRAGRRPFGERAREALAVSGAELLDHRRGRGRGETVVQFRFRERRFECVVATASLRIVDAGICLEDHHTGERGDTRFTLESLPAVVGEAIRTGALHVYRHVEGR